VLRHTVVINPGDACAATADCKQPLPVKCVFEIDLSLLVLLLFATGTLTVGSRESGIRFTAKRLRWVRLTAAPSRRVRAWD
jgi:hypothetical protein